MGASPELEHGDVLVPLDLAHAEVPPVVGRSDRRRGRSALRVRSRPTAALPRLYYYSTPRMVVLAEENQPPVPFTQRARRPAPAGLRPRRAAGAPPRRAGTCRACRGGRPRGRRRRCWSAAHRRRAACRPRRTAALALLAEAERLEGEQHHRREGVVDLAHVDVVGRDAGPLERELARAAAGDSVKSSHSLIVVCDVASPVPSTHTGGLAQVAARSSVVSTTAPPPSERMQQCSFVSGSAIMRAAVHVVDGDRVAVVRLGIERRVVAGRHRDLGELLDRRAELVHVPAGGHGVLGDERVPERRVELHRAARPKERLALRRAS